MITTGASAFTVSKTFSLSVMSRPRESKAARAYSPEKALAVSAPSCPPAPVNNTFSAIRTSIQLIGRVGEVLVPHLVHRVFSPLALEEPVGAVYDDPVPGAHVLIGMHHPLRDNDYRGGGLAGDYRVRVAVSYRTRAVVP